MADRDEYVAKMKQRLDELNEQVDELEAKVEKAKRDTAVKYQEKLEELRQKRRESRSMLDDLVSAGEDRWEDIKGRFERTWKAFDNSVKYFRAQLK